MVLRKQLETGRIAAIRQHELDRLLLMDIDTLAAGGRIATKTLVMEFMGKYSNLILVQDGIIMDALRKSGPIAAASAPSCRATAMSFRPDRTSWICFPPHQRTYSD